MQQCSMLTLKASYSFDTLLDELKTQKCCLDNGRGRSVALATSGHSPCHMNSHAVYERRDSLSSTVLCSTKLSALALRGITFPL
jgi:hypothetical protein